ncbi:hypothetical protein DSO57_1007462 [Entomophthora muscae]|uniref:Uncharacterized protein n=1 Tax=Entomophthora muscae TaxID=34485 RepID=A0ACC2SWL2_9FUNG|nr:hypothetical protein DSO57_1007462 [Entomophthora muscae]
MNLWFNQIISYLLLVLLHLQSTPCGPVPRAHIPQETVDQPPKLYCPPGAHFGPVHFNKYPPNPVYLEFNLEEILIHNPEARNRETETVYREGIKITIPPLLFRDKYNFLPAYLVPMTPPLTPRPNRLQESIVTDESTSTQIFGVMYITLTGLIDFMVPTSKPWAILGKLLSYIVKLALILWWALPSGPAAVCPQVLRNPPQVGFLTNNHTYQLKDAQGNTKKLHHDCLCPCRAILHKSCLCRPSQTFCRLRSWCLTTSREQGGCCNQVYRLAC